MHVERTKMAQELIPATPETLQEEVMGLIGAVKFERERIDQLEQALTSRVCELAKCIQLYNRERLNGLVAFLAGKGLAYYEEGYHNGRLVREMELGFETESGIRGEYFGEYDSYYREVPYCVTHFKLGGRRQSHDGETVRERWTAMFKDRFAITRNYELPAWLLVALESGMMPPEPIGCHANSSKWEDTELGRPAVLSCTEGTLRVRFFQPNNFYELSSNLRIG